MADLNSRKNSTYVVLGIGVAFVAIILFQFFSLQNPSTYETQIQKLRADKDLEFRNSPDSPIEKAKRPNFEGIRYFPIQQSYVVEATLDPPAKKDTVQMMTSTGKEYFLSLAGMLSFELQGTTQKLIAYRYVDVKRQALFVPFFDLTNGSSTYGGGRYLEVPYNESSTVTLDFNRAYHPYCVYSEDFTCPIPPRENRILLEIRAGELMPKE
ncbi:MAG: DUF1684 domain-containing protein [Bacteroidota bacterium]